jgi:hydrogenase nickel incorporation protein HypB
MCETCGCGKPGEFSIHDKHDIHDHVHSHGDLTHSHPHSHEHPHEDSHANLHEHFHDHQDEKPEIKLITLQTDILAKNNLLAERNRGWLEGRDVLCMNLVSSPGSGKTTILEKTIGILLPDRQVFVIEGDQQTSLDADRINHSGAAVVQINTGTGCHLDAQMVNQALKKLDVVPGSVLFIENVGNLVCPALFDLGEKKRVVVISVTEGDDKPLKYPYMFQSSDLCIINKSDLLPYVDFDVEKTKHSALKLNPRIEFILMSAKTGEGMEEWIGWISRLKIA